MAFDKLKDLDSTDMREWANSPCTALYVNELVTQRDLAFKKLLKEGEKKHCHNAETYKAFGKALQLIEEARNLK